MNSLLALSGETQEVLNYLDQTLVPLVKVGINGIASRLQGGLCAMLKERENLRRDLMVIEQLADEIGPNSPNKTMSRILLGVWDRAEQEIEKLYSDVYIKHSYILRDSLADMQSYDKDFPTNYNQYIIFFDKIISSRKSCDQMIHFLIDLYYFFADDSSAISLLKGIQEFITVLSILPRFDMNIKDEKGKTPLMRIMENQREIDTIYGNMDNNLKKKKENIQNKLLELASILQDGYTEIGLTLDQLHQQKSIKNEQATTRVQQEVTGNIILRIVNGSLSEEILND